MNDRTQRERDFHNKAFHDRSRESTGKFYSITRSCRKHYANLVLSSCPGKNVLEYGCGVGTFASRLAMNGAHVTAIDISEEAIRQSDKILEKEGLRSQVLLRVMDAEHLEFKDNSFDIICGTGILHHLDLKRSLSEIARVLKPEGKAFFIEPMGHNPFINLYRRLTPGLRTEDEHPLLSADFRLMMDFFEVVHVTRYHFLTLLAVPFRNIWGFSKMLSILEFVDCGLFNLPFFKNQAWRAVIELSHPGESQGS